jgi:hypothetical protein
MSYKLFSVTIAWKDAPTEPLDRVICVGDGSHLSEYEDDEIFFYVRDLEELQALANPDNGEDFYIIQESE